MKRSTTPLALVLLASACTVFACNLKDPIAAPPASDCQDDSDCNGGGTCQDDGVCDCTDGYSGDFCAFCDVGFLRINGICESTSGTNGTNGGTNNDECEDGQVLLGEECVDDLCGDDPCGPGTCTMSDPSTYECSCPDGTTGDTCPDCDDETCVNGVCNQDTGLCECEGNYGGPTCDGCAPGWQGDACDSCTPEAFGEDCTTCQTLYDAQDWWNTDYRARSAVVVYNTMLLDVAGGIAVPVMFDHAAVVNLGGLPDGDDVRLVTPDGAEIDRILAPNSAWNQADTRVLFSNPAPVETDQFNVVYSYLGADDPEPPLDDVSSVLQPERGWAYDNASSTALYAAQQRSSASYSVGFRQLGMQRFELYVTDASDNDIQTTLEIRDAATGNTLETRTVSSVGTVDAPGVSSEEILNLPRSFRVLLQTQSVGAVAHWYGDTEYTATGDLSQNRTFSRDFSAGPQPQVRICPPETQE